MNLQAKGLLLHCRGGFEGEVASEAAQAVAEAGNSGFARAKADTAFLRFELYAPQDWRELLAARPFPDWVFARERYAWIDRIENLPQQDRAGVIATQLAAMGLAAGRVSCEFADTNEAKEMSGFLRRFTPHLEKALQKVGVLRAQATLPTLHLFFESSEACDIGLSAAGDSSPWPMGVPRLRMPRGAPSRSTLKLAEAFYALMSEAEREKGLRAGLRAVDLGACPGGWTLQFAQRGIHVQSVDNGPMAEAVLETGMVEHVRADGFTWRPKKPVDWMVCDMVEQPARVARLMADWVASRSCRRTIFNLKLPMKKRFDEINRCREIIDKALTEQGLSYTLRMKHLYHDREEITAYLALG
ncbi:23S rRNA (cytidine(2498)-2'-O)-methyltransferase RlmM [Viridibacterium curvum]|uniref:Ribosomal RNA large subunit methyltransferase M n=1 Tax=Viridibacterium curvum TaxID=1101404 RepID=A0ABP9QYS9_9RHOO